MKTLILASGEGVRLRPLTDKVNKAMLPVAGKPVLEHIVDHLVRHGLRDIVMAVGVKKEGIMDYFKDGKDFGVAIQYSIGEGVRNTAGEIDAARNFLEDDNFLLYYGDTLTGINLNVLYEFHRHNNALVTTPVICGIPTETSLVRYGDNGQVTEFIEKPLMPEMANIPVFIVNAEVLKHPNIAIGRDFSSDVLAELVSTERVFAYDEEFKHEFVNYEKFPINPHGNYHYDVGTVKRYEQICEAFEKGKVGEVRIIK